jgi:hypothetical protein
VVPVWGGAGFGNPSKTPEKETKANKNTLNVIDLLPIIRIAALLSSKASDSSRKAVGLSELHSKGCANNILVLRRGQYDPLLILNCAPLLTPRMEIIDTRTSHRSISHLH